MKGKGLSQSLYSRLKLSSDKLGVLASGLRQIAKDSQNILGRTISSMELAASASDRKSEPLTLVKETVCVAKARCDVRKNMPQCSGDRCIISAFCHNLFANRFRSVPCW